MTQLKGAHDRLKNDPKQISDKLQWCVVCSCRPSVLTGLSHRPVAYVENIFFNNSQRVKNCRAVNLWNAFLHWKLGGGDGNPHRTVEPTIMARLSKAYEKVSEAEKTAMTEAFKKYCEEKRSALYLSQMAIEADQSHVLRHIEEQVRDISPE